LISSHEIIKNEIVSVFAKFYILIRSLRKDYPKHPTSHVNYLKYIL